MKPTALLAALVAAASTAAPIGAPVGALAAAPPPKPPQYVASDYRALDPENTLVIDTTKGRIVVEMYPELAPQSVARIKALARAKFYDGLTFHRVVDDFMAQGGDPKGDGSGGSTMPDVPAEFTVRRGADLAFVQTNADAGREDGFYKAMPLRSQSGDLMVMTADGKVTAWGLWCPGVAGMARNGEPNSANSQYYLMRQASDQLDQKYTPWGRAVSGLDVVRALKTGEPVVNPDKMTSVRVMADMTGADRPKLTVLDTASPGFQALLTYDKSLHGGSFNICDVELPVR